MPIKRLNYFDQQFLLDTDFTDEQQYHLDIRRRLTKGLHTSGVVWGLEVTTWDSTHVHVNPGFAIDGNGCELVFEPDPAKPEQQQFLVTRDDPSKTDVSVTIAYDQQPTDDSTVTGAPNLPTRWTEAPVIVASTTAPSNDGRVLLAQFTLNPDFTVPGAQGNGLGGLERQLAGAVAPSQERLTAALHTWGIAWGLEVTKTDESHVAVAPGVAIDLLGREIFLPVQQFVPVDPTYFAGYIRIAYQERAYPRLTRELQPSRVPTSLDLAQLVGPQPWSVDSSVRSRRAGALLAVGSVGSGELAAAAVTDAAMADHAVMPRALAPNVVGPDALAAGAVTNAALGAGAVFEANLEATLAGKINFQTTLTRLLHTPGIADGLEVLSQGRTYGVKVNPGTAIDPQGRALIVPPPRTVDDNFLSVEGFYYSGLAWVYARYPSNAGDTILNITQTQPTDPNAILLAKIQLREPILGYQGPVPGNEGDELDGGVRRKAGAKTLGQATQLFNNFHRDTGLGDWIEAPLRTNGGTLMIFVSGSGKGNPGTIGMSIAIDDRQKELGKAQIYTANPDLRVPFAANALVVSGLAGGDHTFYLTPLTGTSTDINDFFSATVLELPF